MTNERPSGTEKLRMKFSNLRPNRSEVSPEIPAEGLGDTFVTFHDFIITEDDSGILKDELFAMNNKGNNIHRLNQSAKPFKVQRPNRKNVHRFNGGSRDDYSGTDIGGYRKFIENKTRNKNISASRGNRQILGLHVKAHKEY